MVTSRKIMPLHAPSCKIAKFQAKLKFQVGPSVAITKLSDIGVPGWLLKFVTGFLTNSKMVIMDKGKISDIKNLPGERQE